MAKKLPLLISIPHAGLEVPEELEDRQALEEEEILGESDTFTSIIYDLGDRVAKVIDTDIARAFVDLNRDPEHLPPENEDGVVKDVTTYGAQVYQEGKEPGHRLMEKLISEYYEPYHRMIREALETLELELALDCHSMAGTGPPLAKDAGKKRPVLCLGNVWGKSAPDKTLYKLAGCFREAFHLPEEQVSLNRPFPGGYITRTYGGEPIPWVQIEISRDMYLVGPWFDREKMEVDENRLFEIRDMFERAVGLFFDREG